MSFIYYNAEQDELHELDFAEHLAAQNMIITAILFGVPREFICLGEL
jgi:hypothetical protein